MPAWIDLPVEEIVERYTEGESVRALGRAYGVGRVTVWNRLHAAGVRMRPCGEAGGGVRGNKNSSHRPGGPLCGHPNGYLQTYGRNGKNCLVHRACWEAYSGPIPEGHVIHHINGDPLDNRTENLACMPSGEHTRLHAQTRQEG